MRNVDNNKSVFLDNTLSGNTELQRLAKEWITKKQSRYRYTSGDITSDIVKRNETTLTTLETVSKKSCFATGFNIVRSNYATTHSASQSFSSETAKSGRVTEDERIKTAERNLTLTATIEKTIDKNHQLNMENSANRVERLVSFPSSQLIIRNKHSGPVMLAFTNNYKTPVIWALKTNALKRLAAFPTTGIIPPSGTVQIKIDLVGQIPTKNSKDRLSLEYFITDGKVVSDRNYYNYLHRNESSPMKKCLEVVYI